MNIEKYIKGSMQTANGIVYKDVEAFNTHKGICYIGELGLSDLSYFLDKGEDLTDEEIVEKCIGSTYDSIVEELTERWEEIKEANPDYVEIVDVNLCAKLVFSQADWSFISTVIDQLTY